MGTISKRHPQSIVKQPLQNTTDVGNFAEDLAQHFLEKKGLCLIEKNFVTYDLQGKKNGEIDLIMRDQTHLVFVEVKSRKSKQYGDAIEMISTSKRANIIRTAKYYLVQNQLYDREYCRFDVVGITPSAENPQQPKITWIKNAFEVEY